MNSTDTPYQHQRQFAAMADALMRGQFTPSLEVNRRFKDTRINTALKALRCRNLFVPAQGNYLAANSNNSFTCFTPPLGGDVIVFGCSLSSDLLPTTNAMSIIRGEVRIRPPAPLCDNHIQPQKAFGPATYSIYFPCPFLLEAGDQIAVDFGFNAPEAGDTSVDTAEQQILFFCVQVKECFDAEEETVAEQIKREVEGRDYQRKLFLPCTAPLFTSAAGQDRLGRENATRPVSNCVLVTGYSLTYGVTQPEAARLSLGDTAEQYSFTMGRLVHATNLFWPFSAIEQGIRGPYYSYFRLPVPHLLRPGAQLVATSVGPGAPPNGDLIALVFDCLLV